MQIRKRRLSSVNQSLKICNPINARSPTATAVNALSYCILHGWLKGSSAPITCKALVLAHDLHCVLYQPHAMRVMELYGGGEGIEGLHLGLHSVYIVSRESHARRQSWLMTCLVYCINHKLCESQSFTEGERELRGYIAGCIVSTQ